MAYYSFINDNNIVTLVIGGKDETDRCTSQDWEQHYQNSMGQTCKKTSYNTMGGEHTLGGTPFRKNFAGIGMIYDASIDAFYHPQPFPSWVLDEATCYWSPPSSRPTDGKYYVWDENTTGWIEATDPSISIEE